MEKNKLILLGTSAVSTLMAIGIIFWAKQDVPVKSSPETVKSNLEYLVKDHSPIKGDKNAPITIVEFLDPECEACRSMHPIVQQLLTEYNGKIKVVIRYMLFHGNSRLAAVSLEEARDQGKYDQALDILFEKQPEWADHANPRADLIPTFLQQAGVNVEKFDSSLLVTKHGQKVDMDHSDGTALGVRQTPTFFVDGEKLPSIGYQPLKEAIEDALSKK